MAYTKYRGRARVAKKPMARRPAVKRPVKRVPKKSVKAIVKSVLRADTEVKKVYNIDIANQYNVPGSGINYGPQSLGWTSGSLIPNPAIGTSSASRIGNKINVRSLNVRYSIYANPSTDTGYTNPFIGLPFLVKVVVYRARYSTSDSSPMGIINDGASQADLTSIPDTFFRPYNRDQFIIGYSKVHKMIPPRWTGPTFNSSQSQDPQMTGFIVRSFNLKMPKHLIYNDNASAFPTNAAWYMSIAVCNVDGSTVTAAQSRCKINVESYLMFTDE